MHPIIQFSCFFLLIIGLTLAQWSFFIITLVLLSILYWRYGELAQLRRALRRLRWLLLSLVILYLWFSRPDVHWIPDWEGVVLALERVGALVMIVIAANLLLQVNSTAQLVATLQWYLHPLRRLGLPTERLAVRLVLVLDTLQAVEQLYAPAEAPPELEKRGSPLGFVCTKIQFISQRFTTLFQQVLIHAEQVPLQVLTIPTIHAPPWWQWGYPLSLGVLMRWGL